MNFFIFFVGLISLSAYANQESSLCPIHSDTSMRELNRSYSFGNFNIYYNDREFSNTAAIKEVPDAVINLSRQLSAANNFFLSNLHLSSPLLHSPYKFVDTINVFYSKIKLDGFAFSSPSREIIANGETTRCGLKIIFNSRLDPTKSTAPAHELFHLYQYRYSQFKQGWYLEGLARWSESIFRRRNDIAINEVTRDNCNLFFNDTYHANVFWRSIAVHYPDIKITGSQRQLTYLNNDRIFKEIEFTGGGLIKKLLVNLEKASFDMSKVRGFQPFNWPVSARRSADLNPFICQHIPPAATS